VQKSRLLYHNHAWVIKQDLAVMNDQLTSNPLAYAYGFGLKMEQKRVALCPQSEWFMSPFRIDIGSLFDVL
jgi:hypothetical protein